MQKWAIGSVWAFSFVIRRRLTFLGFAWGTLVALRADFPFAEATIDELQARMSAGGLTAEALTAAYLERIEQVDRGGPRLNAVIEINPDALAVAGQLDAERRRGQVRGPLHGIPVLIKDNIATADKMETTAGSLALVGLKPPRDAHLVSRLREAGAVILGKTNLSEWSNFRGERSISGWSARGGQTRNPYVLDRSPSGSSSGSAVAVAANLCVAAIGTETNGSIISPCSVGGVVGLKPTVGLVSRHGIIPIAASFDTAGPITRTVGDAAIMLRVLAGADGRDEATAAVPADWKARWREVPTVRALQGARIGVLRSVEARGVDKLLAAGVVVLRTAGAEIVEVGSLPDLASAGPARIEVMLYEMKVGINAYLAELGPSARFKTLAAVIRFNEENWAREQPLFGQQYFQRAEGKGPLTDPAYLEARALVSRLARTEGIDRLMETHRLDALVGGGVSLAAMAGYPSVTVPFEENEGVPVGFLFFGRAWSEARLLALAADFEQRTRARREPAFKAKFP